MPALLQRTQIGQQAEQAEPAGMAGNMIHYMYWNSHDWVWIHVWL